jgi:flagellar biosynthesis protein FlhG
MPSAGFYSHKKGSGVYYQLVNKMSQGPYTFDQLRDMAKLGTFTPTSLVWYPLQNQWQWTEARRIIEFVEVFRSIEMEAIEAVKLEARQIRREVADGSRPPTTIIAVGGGKGGIGKTSLTVGFGLCLAAMDQSVILVDCDLGGSNLLTALGLPEPSLAGADFFVNKVTSVEQLLTPTGVDRFRVIGGKGGVLGLANLKYARKLKFINQLRTLDADFVLLDLGAGTSYDVLDFFLSCDRGIVITCPDPFSLENAFGFLKTAMYRSVLRSCSSDEIVRRHLKQQAGRAYQPTIFQFLGELRAESPESADRVWTALAACPRELILNMVRNRSEIKETVAQIDEMSRQLSVALKLLGSVAYDDFIRKAMLTKSPFVLSRPTARASLDLLKIASEKFMPAAAGDVSVLRRGAIRRLRKIRIDAPSS